jgi:hypothetical protein
MVEKKQNLIVKHEGRRDRVFYGVTEVEQDEETGGLTFLNASKLPSKIQGDYVTSYEVVDAHKVKGAS